MALPKEPRQKMINIMYLVLTALLALNVSVEILNAFKTVKTSLDKSSSAIDDANTKIFKELAAKLADDKTKQQATIYAPMAANAKQFCDQVYDSLAFWKDSLIKASAGYKVENGDTDFNQGDIETPTRLFIEHNNGENLLAQLTKLKSNLLTNLSADPKYNTEIATIFGDKLPIDLSVPRSQSGNSHDSWEYSYFHMTPSIAALTMLSKFQNDVKNAENEIVTYCNNQITSVQFTYDQYKPLVSLSSNYLMPGEKLTVTAGVGAFSSASRPTIIIDGQTKDASQGFATTDITVGGSGNGQVAYDISFKDQTGKDQHFKDFVPYTVGQPSTASVALDKEDVFYIGLDNPITIGSPTGMEKTGVHGEGCTINGSGPHRTVTVSAPGTCSITVSPAGSTPFTHTYRIKRIPEPEFKVGSGKVRMTSVEFKSQQYCRADMGPDFIYDVHYNVVGATVYFSGAGFPNPISTSIDGNSLAKIESYMQRCVPGSTVTFDVVKVKGPDGERVIDGKSIALY